MATIEAMVVMEEVEAAMVEAAMVAMVAKVMNIIKVGNVTEFQ